MPVLLLILNIALILVCSACALACLQLRGTTSYLIGAYVVSYADIVLVLEVAGLLSAIRAAPVLALQILLTGVSALAWFRRGRPPLLGPFAGLRLPRPNLQSLLNPFRQSPLPTSLVLVLAGSVAYVYLLHARLILAIYPDNYDALTYHLSRVGYWLQYHSLYPWPTPNLRQTTFPMNAELGVLWTIMWWGTDRLSGFVQWTTVPVIMLGIYGLTRLLHYSRWQGAMAGLLWATLTQVLYQSSTTQNDLVTTSFWVGTLYFFFAGLRGRKQVLILLSGLSFGLAIGTKGTSLIVLPGLGVVLVLVAVFSREDKLRRWLITWAGACLLGIALFGSYAYVQNTIAFGNPLGASSRRTGPIVLQAQDGVLTYARRLRDNLARYAYQIVDLSPLPFGIARRANPLKATLFNEVFQVFRIDVENRLTIAQRHTFGLGYINPMEEDSSWFGPLAAVLAVAVIVQAYLGARGRDLPRLALAIIAISFLLAQSAAQQWTPLRGRYYVIPAALCFPLMACFVNARTHLRAALAGFLVLLALIVMFTATLSDGRLQHATWGEAFAGARSAPSWTNKFDYRLMTENVPASSSIGVVSNDDFPDYPFFGEYFKRRVTLAIPDDTTILPRADTTRYASDFQHSDFLFVVGSDSHFIPDVASHGFDLLSSYYSNSLWIRDDLRSVSDCDDRKWPFTDFFQSSFSAVCARFPLSAGQVAGIAQDSFLETGRFVPVIGVGPNAQFDFSLLVKAPTRARILIQVDPAKTTRSQTLQLALSAEGSQPMIFSAPFDTRQVLAFVVGLDPGTYKLHLGLANGEAATVHRFQVMEP